MMNLGDEKTTMDTMMSEKLLADDNGNDFEHNSVENILQVNDRITDKDNMCHSNEPKRLDDENYDLIPERETLVFDDVLRGSEYKGTGEQSLLQLCIMSKIQPGSGMLQSLSETTLANCTVVVKGSMFTMTVAIVGAGILSLPYAVKQAGLVLGILLIILGAIITNISLRLLLSCSDAVHARSYMDLARITGTLRLAQLTQFTVCLNLYGTCVGYLVGGAELIQLALKTFLQNQSTSIFIKREILILILTVMLVTPLSLLHSLESLRFTSLFSILCIASMTLTIVIKYFQFVHLGYAPDIVYQLQHLPLFDFHLHRLLETIPIVTFVFTCHPNILPIYLMLKRRSSRRMYKVMNRSIGLATVVYCLCSVFVVLTFGERTKSNFLKNDYHGDGAILMGSAGFSIALILTVPLFIHTLRDNIKEVLLEFEVCGKSNLQHISISLCLIVLICVTALNAGDITSVLQVLGATTNPLICFILPAFFLWKTHPSTMRMENIFTLTVAFIATVISILSLFQQAGLLHISSTVLHSIWDS